MSEKEILLIEDDPDIVTALSALCEPELGLRLVGRLNGDAGLAAALAQRYALVIADVNLPGKNGFDICREIRAAFPEQLVMLLTGRKEEVDKVLGLEIGADDYVTKPFSSRELVARIRALLRRRAIDQSSVPRSCEEIRIADLRIDVVGRRVWKGGNPVKLTMTEYDLLELLASNPGRTFDRRELTEAVMGYSTATHDDVLSVHLSRVRAKIEDKPEAPRLILTVRGVGYRFAAPDEVENGV